MTNIAMERVQAAALTPESVMRRLDDLERDLASRQGELEAAAYAWFVAKRERERLWATAFLASGAATVAERKAEADLECAVYGKDDEARYEALKAATRVLETRASIGMSLLRSYGRAAG